MFIEFTVGNFKSFRDKTTFSMVAANLTSENEELDSDNVIPVKKDLSLLKTSAIYGANASGKSNFGVALRFMRDFVLNSSRETFADAEIAVEPFLLDRKTLNEPSFFEIVFLLDGTQYRYGFEVDKSHVVSEWLFRAKARETTLFTREENDIQVKAAFKEGQGLQARTRPNALFLSVLAQFDGDAANQIRRWFGTLEIETGLQDENMRGYTLQCLRNPKQKNDIVAFLKTLDLDIDDVQASEPPPIEAVLSSLPSEEVQQIVDRLRKIIYTVHRFGEGKKDIALFDLDQHESQGTRKLVALAGPLSSILANGQTIFIDELDARLHPLVTRRIIEIVPLASNKSA